MARNNGRDYDQQPVWTGAGDRTVILLYQEMTLGEKEEREGSDWIGRCWAPDSGPLK